MPVAAVAAIPNGVGFEHAASVPLGALTAWHIVEDANLKAGQTVVVRRGGRRGSLRGPVRQGERGSSIRGGSRGNLDFVRSLGAEAIDYTAAGPVSAKIKNADVVVDTVGGEALTAAYALVWKGGVLLTVAGMPSEDKAKELGITAKGSGNRSTEPLAGIAEMLAAKKLVVEHGRIFPLAEVGSAQDLSQSGHGRGRILLKV